MPGQITEEDLKNMSPEEILALQKQNCVFCNIIAGRIPSKRVYEDDKVIAILDINPATKGHILLMTKEHYQIMPQIPDELVKYMFMIAKGLCKSALVSLAVKGTNIFVANGAVAGQKAPHFIVHVIPREEGDGVSLTLPQNSISREMTQKVKQQMLGKVAREVSAEIVEEKKDKAVEKAETEREKKPGGKVNLDDIASLF